MKTREATARHHRRRCCVACQWSCFPDGSFLEQPAHRRGRAQAGTENQSRISVLRSGGRRRGSRRPGRGGLWRCRWSAHAAHRTRSSRRTGRPQFAHRKLSRLSHGTERKRSGPARRRPGAAFRRGNPRAAGSQQRADRRPLPRVDPCRMESEVGCRALLIATGIAFRKLDVPGLDQLSGAGVYYYAPMSEAFSYRDGDIYIVGGANSAGQAAMYFSKFARQVTMLVRGNSLSDSMSQYLENQIAATKNIEVQIELQRHRSRRRGSLRNDHHSKQQNARDRNRPRQRAADLRGSRPANGLARGNGRARCAGLPHFRPAPDARRQTPDRLDCRSRSVLSRNQRAGHFRGRRCPPSLRQRRYLWRRRRRHGRETRPPVSRTCYEP